MKSLNEIRHTIHAALPSESIISLVTTRVMLRTGVDLNGIKQQEDADVEVVARVIEALQAMGFSPSSLALVAAQKKRG